MIFNKKKTNKIPYVTERSNVIQLDSMGYPLRLIINSDGKQEWIDTVEEDDDVVLVWKTHCID